jgi:hypothetical protein
MLTGSRASIAGAREAACAAREAGEAGGADERFSARRYGRHGRAERAAVSYRSPCRGRGSGEGAVAGTGDAAAAAVVAELCVSLLSRPHAQALAARRPLRRRRRLLREERVVQLRPRRRPPRCPQGRCCGCPFSSFAGGPRAAAYRGGGLCGC